MSETKKKQKVTTPPISDEAYQKKLIALALQQVEHQLKEKTASSQVLNHYLTLASKIEDAKLKKLELETRLLEAKIDSEKSNQNVQDMFEDVLDALRSYGVRHDKNI